MRKTVKILRWTIPTYALILSLVVFAGAAAWILTAVFMNVAVSASTTAAPQPLALGNPTNPVCTLQGTGVVSACSRSGKDFTFGVTGINSNLAEGEATILTAHFAFSSNDARVGVRTLNYTPVAGLAVSVVGPATIPGNGDWAGDIVMDFGGIQPGQTLSAIPVSISWLPQ